MDYGWYNFAPRKLQKDSQKCEKIWLVFGLKEAKKIFPKELQRKWEENMALLLPLW
jgi:translation initiation factor IF-3